ncbi:anaerobic ribonucleoside-triphosphate reductase activating protein [Bacteroides sp. UBA939]|uniref:anaerobic ribonucleoside-triphosphate reductase activating protein n=1 Tax=Bacteroides sp. UBA939 TaxID=1946092 RepID=UPI0025C61963|nr:anaerobic ribonucleoside-triphosphate reductase activating protein [Bacteroides sp. UBA939]
MLKYTDYDIVFQEIPDEVTLAINLSNCPNRCKGCHSPYLQKDVGEVLTKESLSVLLRKYGKAVTCVCFMGGDAAPKDVEHLANFLQQQHISPVKVGWYSGKPELPAGFSIQSFQYIKLGPYIESCGSLKSAQTNQRLYKIAEGEMNDITYLFRKGVDVP